MENTRKKFALWLEIPHEKLSIFARVLLFSPIAIWFSFWPRISFGADATTNFKLTFTLFYVAVLAIFAFFELAKNHARAQKIFAKSCAFWLVSAFVLLNFCSVFWSENRSRATLTLAVIFALYLIFCALIVSRKMVEKLLVPLAKILLVSALAMSILALVQFVAGVYFSRDFTLLCPGCVAGQFAFPRPNVFTIEPQFFGNILLAPALILIAQNFAKGRELFSPRAFFWVEFFVFLALFLTLSRGAIFAFCLGALATLAFNFREFSRIFSLAILVVLAFLGALFLQSFGAEMNPNFHENFVVAAESSLNQLSLGAIKFGEKSPETKAQISHNVDAKKPAFTGYVVESTTTRVGLSKTAFRTWQNADLARKIFGFGLGSSGVAMAKFAQTNDQKQIVQNEFLEILLELGAVGFLLFLAILAGFARVILRNKNARWALGLVVAFGAQWLFFSGYPSALHVYLILALTYIFAKNRSKNAIIAP